MGIVTGFCISVVLEQGCFDLQYVPTSENLADICTKRSATRLIYNYKLI